MRILAGVLPARLAGQFIASMSQARCGGVLIVGFIASTYAVSCPAALYMVIRSAMPLLTGSSAMPGGAIVLHHAVIGQRLRRILSTSSGRIAVAVATSVHQSSMGLAR